MASKKEEKYRMLLTKTLTMAGTLAVVTLAGLSTGCATKKFVRTEIDPVQAQVEKVGQKSDQNAKQIAEVDERLTKQVDSANERAMGADGKARDAAKRADDAMTKASTATDQAVEAKQYSEKGFQNVDKKFQSLGQYSTLTEDKVQFDFNRSELSAEAKATLDGLASQMSQLSSYQVEVEGFTDASGNPGYNEELSRKRADSVVRYLTVERQIPLYRIHVVGLGEASPASDNKTREGRKENRRVVIRVLKPTLDATSTTVAAVSTNN